MGGRGASEKGLITAQKNIQTQRNNHVQKNIPSASLYKVKY